MIDMKRLLFLLLATLGMPLCVAFSQREEVLYEGFLNIASMQRKVRDVVEVKRSPLFDNAPFLRLREMDQLVKAKEVHQEGKPFANPERISYYLLSGGTYYELWVQEENGRLLLSPYFYGADACLLFDWDLTLANARSLRKILPTEFSESLTRNQYGTILSAVRKEFPEINVGWEEANPAWQPERMISIPGQTIVEFQGLGYELVENCIYKYWIRIGPSVFSITGVRILQGPKRVERSEFERERSDGPALPNANPSSDVDPKTAKIKKAEYDRMVKFRELVRNVIQDATP